ncbi:hypothetical protein KAFR_0E01860 [Kazachstania africana CBS 2517]|uniref:AmmeMemoRadiSam system protein B n=1 Tax=Kazachstania africana (strain ATCC 22294 / BCRC 22015 / CBS 2517 / CECT 1963 / NBRC 1671 / NRRL Y-8276) TaxID=1071382 RepID=H2AVE0_KAZAF|nr:hypothetical protein KAFR_0E01860 [Kazachstania africana CBS 2517]CCF58340.1 hypothetical protein KAFR_0E01860 [Kazachstania africana CBS 2517]
MKSKTSIRKASHAGTWYLQNSTQLQTQLQSNLNATKLVQPIKGSRIIISPHAGYRYCGNVMAYSYASMDLTKFKNASDDKIRVFILGPSHHIYFRDKILVSSFEEVETPLGNLTVDREVVDELIKKNHNDKKVFELLDKDVDLDEHSLEMQFSMLAQTLHWRSVDLSKVKVIPMLVSHNSETVDSKVAGFLKPYLNDGKSFFIISSDFCHWGRRFEYTGYVGNEDDLNEAMNEETEIEMLTSRSKLSHHQISIWKSIELLDKYAMKVLSGEEIKKETDSNEPNEDLTLYEKWKEYLDITGNTICGQNPIKLILKLLEELNEDEKFEFEWLNYSQSSKVSSIEESSVSYASGCVRIK